MKVQYFFSIILISVLGYPSWVSAQTPQQIDSLEHASKTATDTLRVKALCQLASIYLYSQPSKALAAGENALSLSNRLHFQKGIANSNNSIGNYYYQTGEYNKALEYQRASLKIREKMNDNFGMAKSYINLANAYYGLGNFKAAISTYFQGLKYAEMSKSVDLTTMAYTNLANVYYDLKNFKEALRLTLIVIKTREQNGDYNGLAFAYNNAGVMYRDMSNYELALKSLKQACNASLKSNNQALLASALSNIADVYNRQGKPDLALNSQKESLKIQQQLGDKLGIAASFGVIAATYLNKKDYVNSANYYRQMQKLAAEMNNSRTMAEAYNGLSKIAEAKGDFGSALSYYKQQVNLKDTILNENTTKQIAELETKYKTEKKQQQIALLNKENTIQKLSISKRNTTIGLISGIFLISAAFSGLFYNRNKLKQSARLQAEIIRQQDLATKAVLEAEENERKRIAGDLHDGVGQMFSTVKMNLSGIEDQIGFKDDAAKSNFQKTILLVDESCREVRSISHQMAPNVLLKSGLVSAIRDFITKVDERRLKINLDVQGITERLDSNVETVLYRVIQESVNNVIKHAKASRLDIQLIKDADGLSAMIEDNGVGFNSKDQEKAEGLGLKNIASRISYLKGTVDFDSSPGQGTVVSIWIPSAS